MMKTLKKKTYEALGFVESMLAIMIVGVSSMVLMQIAVNTMQNILQNEAIDDMTQYAVEGGEITQDIALRQEVNEEEDIFPDPIEYQEDENCFMLEKKEGAFYFKKKEEGGYDKFDNDEEGVNREVYKDIAILNEDDRLFRFVCLEGAEEESTFVMAEIVVGQRNSSGTITRGNLAKDYIYRTVIKLVAVSTLEPPPVDCPDGTCNHLEGETAENCIDCVVCGDGLCTFDESADPSSGDDYCPEDCAVCGEDEFCSRPVENETNCPADCFKDEDCVDYLCESLLKQGIVRECNSNKDCVVYCDEHGYCSDDGSECPRGDIDCF
jgi:hypothetical protein